MSNIIKWKEKPKTETLVETFGQRLRRIRKEKGLKQIELAMIIGIESAQISSYEKGKSMPKIVSLEWLCTALGVTATELLGF